MRRGWFQIGPSGFPDPQRLAHRLFASQRNVRNVRSYFSIHRSKFETAIPLGAAADAP